MGQRRLAPRYSSRVGASVALTAARQLPSAHWWRQSRCQGSRMRVSCANCRAKAPAYASVASTAAPRHTRTSVAPPAAPKLAQARFCCANRRTPTAVQIGIQIRVGDWQLVSSHRYFFHPDEYPNFFNHYFRCARELERDAVGGRDVPVEWFLMTDTAKLRQHLAAKVWMAWREGCGRPGFKHVDGLAAKVWMGWRQRCGWPGVRRRTHTHCSASTPSARTHAGTRTTPIHPTPAHATPVRVKPFVHATLSAC
eukprot:366146-Chlamydomonas_euryale.AAC.1